MVEIGAGLPTAYICQFVDGLTLTDMDKVGAYQIDRAVFTNYGIDLKDFEKRQKDKAYKEKVGKANKRRAQKKQATLREHAAKLDE